MSKKNITEIVKPKLWIVTEVFYPDQTSTAYIMSKIANKMTEKYEVHVITTDTLYQQNSKISENYFKLEEAIEVVRIKSGSLNKNNLIQRSIRLFILSNLLYNELKRRISSNEKVFIVTNPAPLLLKCAKLKKKKNILLNILIHDVFPENTIPAGIIRSRNSFLFKLLSCRFNKAYGMADKLIVLGRDMKEVVGQKVLKSKQRPDITIIENWGDVDNIIPFINKPELLDNRHKNGFLTIQYAGNIGRVQGLDSFLELFSYSNNKQLVLDLWGDGALAGSLKELVATKGLNSRVNFYGNYSRDEQNIVLNSMDIALVTLSDGMFGLGVPSKTYNILSAGKPILFIGDLNSEIALLIREESIGFCFSPNDKKGIIDFLNGLTPSYFPLLAEMGNRARIVAENKYSENSILNKFLETL
jgi:glycosyltransferase involved in cell wall biosynthesis